MHYIVLFSLISLLLSTTTTSGSQSYVLDCGAAGAGTDSDGREWEPDTKYTSSSSSMNASSITATAASQDPSLPSTVPYMTARILSSQSTYTFRVSNSNSTRHFLRLHFYPSTYSSLDANTSFFSVAANGFTLLSNFSAFIMAQALTQAYIIREFSLVRFESGTLNLTFTPSPNYTNSYAFVNGIELIPTPDIYAGPASMVGFADQTYDVTNSVLQTMFRIKVERGFYSY